LAYNQFMDDARGLSAGEIASLRAQFGYNELPTKRESSFVQYLKHFWGPLPWLMELLVAINFVSGNSPEAWIIVVLLFINSAISTLQHRSTEAALATLEGHLTVFARAKRDGTWASVPRRELVPGDIIRVRGGDVMPADAAILDGSVSVDTSSLTGESLPTDAAVGAPLYSGSVIRRGEATARVSKIGVQTMYGKTTELLEASHPPTHMERVIFAVIRFFFVWNMVLAVIVVAFGTHVHAAPADIFNFVIVLLLTSVPIAFPTMFAVAQSFGALTLSRGTGTRALVRRLAAVQEFATVDVLCSDKTGTLTQNKLKATALVRYGQTSEVELLSLAAACCDEADRDPIDNAIFLAQSEHQAPKLARSRFVPFNSQTKRTEADVTEAGETTHIAKGLPELLLGKDVMHCDQAHADLKHLSAEGLRVVAVVVERAGKRECVGLVGLSDPIRPDAPQMLREIQALGLRVVMITGDGRATAQTVAAQLGLMGVVATAQELHADPAIALHASVFAETYPEDKLTIIRALQNAGHAVAMTGDGVNDAPALHQAEVGIAVSGASDVARQSASFILTDDGLEGVIAAITMSRKVYSRLRTWILNKIIKSFEVSFFTAVLFLVTHSYIYSPLLAVLLLFANDFVTVSLATDAAVPSPKPGRWKVLNLAMGAVILAAVPMLALTVIYLFAQHAGYSLSELRVAMYFTLVSCGIGTLYAIRAWPHAWQIAPSRTLVAATAFSILFAAFVAGSGLFLPALPIAMLWFIIIVAVGCFFLTDTLKSSGFIRRLVLAEIS
jgi:H+-transporting ATPase